MSGLWCKDFPYVTVEQSQVPKRVTVIYPYFENAEFLIRQFKHWCVLASSGPPFPHRTAGHFSIVVVDDGSPDRPAENVLGARLDREDNPWLRLFRIHEDRRWNWLAARNIGAHEAPNGWLLMTDMDHVIPAATLESVVYGVHRTDTIYWFSRVEHTGAGVAPHPNSFLMTREMFWKVGGYDETLSGHYGTDGDWRRRCAATAKMAILTDTLVRHEFVADSSTTRYARKQPIDAGVKKIIAARGKGWRPKVLSFPYTEVTAQEAVCQ